LVLGFLWQFLPRLSIYFSVVQLWNSSGYLDQAAFFWSWIGFDYDRGMFFASVGIFSSRLTSQQVIKPFVAWSFFMLCALLWLFSSGGRFKRAICYG